jgi:cation diffusion facilitator CzcD-associated flavoprotein CzcO
MAIQLQQAGIHNVVLLEKQAGLGGTWWDNTYPGAHVDVPAPAYSFSFAPNPQGKGAKIQTACAARAPL